jgi:flagellar motor switch protein FliN/FliY
MAAEDPNTGGATPDGAGAQSSGSGSDPTLDEAADAALKAAQEAVASLGNLSGMDTPLSDDAGISDGGAADAAMANAFNFPAFSASSLATDSGSMELLSDVNLNVKIELGRTRMLVSDVLRLAEGSVVELDKLAGDPVDVYVNDRHVARGEVLVLNDNFCVRINQILTLPEAGRPKSVG